MNADYSPKRIQFIQQITLGNLLQIVTIIGSAALIAISGVVFAVRLEGRINIDDLRISMLDQREQSDMSQVKGWLGSIDTRLDIIQKEVTPKGP